MTSQIRSLTIIFIALPPRGLNRTIKGKNPVNGYTKGSPTDAQMAEVRFLDYPGKGK